MRDPIGGLMTDNERVTALDMECVHLCRKLAEAEQSLKQQREQACISEKERRILDMWPRFEDGEPVWFGDVLDFGGDKQAVKDFRIMESGCAIADEFDYEEDFDHGERVKRPAPEVLDADGVPIEVGDTVWEIDQPDTSLTVELVTRNITGSPLIMMRGIALGFVPSELTHRDPDSWQKWERDLRRGETCKEACDDLIRRAKKLAGIEVE